MNYFRNTHLVHWCAFMILALASASSAFGNPIFSDDFEGELKGWTVFHNGGAEIREEVGHSNNILELKPSGRFPPAGQSILSYVLVPKSADFQNTRMEGRVLFPTEGDGYLGFIYNHQQTNGRNDFGCIYVKSNGSYVRVSPHYDGNPSWRLHEERKVSLDGQRKIESGRWYPFRLDVRGSQATLYFGDMTTPVVIFDDFMHDSGSIGLEARPGNGDPVWIDDIRVSKLKDVAPTTRREQKIRRIDGWQALLPAIPLQTLSDNLPSPGEGTWTEIAPDSRGAIVTAPLVQIDSGDSSTVYVRAQFEAGDNQDAGWLYVNSANQLDMWLNGYFQGTVAAEQFIWSDFRSPSRQAGTRIPIRPKPGVNEILIRVDGERFAAGGFFIDAEF